MKVKSIYIDGLHNAAFKTYNFGDINYIFGNNGVGKSTILQAIQFALLGYIPGTAKNSKEALLRHSPKNEINVKLTLNDGQQDIVIERKLTAAGNRINTIPANYDIDKVVADIELPIFNFSKFIGQTANILKDYFIKNMLPTADGKLNWPAILSEAIEDHNFEDKDKMIAYGLKLLLATDGNALDQIIAANTAFKEEQSFKKSELQRLQNTVASLVYYSDYTGPSNLADLNADILSLGAIRDQMIKYNSAVEATRSASEELTRLKAELETMGGQKHYDECSNLLPKLHEMYRNLSESISNKQNALAALRATDTAADSIIQSKGVCPYTKEVCKSIVDKIDELRNESVKHKANNLALASEIEVDSDSLNDLNLQIRKVESTISDFNTAWNRIITLEKTISNLPQKPNTDKSIFELDTEIDQLNQSKSKLQANIQYNAKIDELTKNKYEVELQLNALAAWVKKTDTNGLQTEITAASFEALADNMTEYIRNMYDDSNIKAHFNISSKANSFSFGMIRNGTYIPYDLLSSGEKCLYTLALMICIIDKNSSPLKLLLCDDMFDHLDSAAIESTFATLKNINRIQFIFAGVKECQNASDILITV